MRKQTAKEVLKVPLVWKILAILGVCTILLIIWKVAI